MTGPTSLVVLEVGLTLSNLSAPIVILMSSCSFSFWTSRSRSAEHLCPADWKADFMISSTAFSISALLSTSMVLIPPVSAIRGIAGLLDFAILALMIFAVAVDPVKQTIST